MDTLKFIYTNFMLPYMASGSCWTTMFCGVIAGATVDQMTAGGALTWTTPHSTITLYTFVELRDETFSQRVVVNLRSYPLAYSITLRITAICCQHFSAVLTSWHRNQTHNIIPTCCGGLRQRIPFNGGSFCISLFWLRLNRDEPLFLLSLRMWGDVNWSRFTTVGNVGTGATVLVCVCGGEGGSSIYQYTSHIHVLHNG